MRASAHVRLQWRNSATPREGEGNHVSLAKQPTKQSWSRLTVHGSLKTMPRNCTDSARNRRRDPVRVQALVHRRRQTHQARPTVRSARANRAGSLRSRPSSLGLSRTTSSGKSFGFFWYFVLLVFWYSFVAHSSAPPTFVCQTNSADGAGGDRLHAIYLPRRCRRMPSSIMSRRGPPPRLLTSMRDACTICWWRHHRDHSF